MALFVSGRTQRQHISGLVFVGRFFDIIPGLNRGNGRMILQGFFADTVSTPEIRNLMTKAGSTLEIRT